MSKPSVVKSSDSNKNTSSLYLINARSIRAVTQFTLTSDLLISKYTMRISLTLKAKFGNLTRQDKRNYWNVAAKRN